MRRGKGTTLTPLGAKLLWAEQCIGASVFPQLANIASELNLEISRALKESRSVIRVHASHGYAVEKLPSLMHRHAHVNIDLQYMGSMVALEALHRSQCDLAGFHIPLGDLGENAWRSYAKCLKWPLYRIIRMVIRKQGLIVAKGNPLALSSLRDLTSEGVRFVNRQRGSGTRTLLDTLLHSFSVDPQRVHGYDSGEFTHAAVAAFVASGMAHAGFGVEAAARQFKLDFLPMMEERYMLACRTESLREPAICELISLLQGQEFEETVRQVPGYSVDNPGEIVTVQSVFPWLAK